MGHDVLTKSQIDGGNEEYYPGPVDNSRLFSKLVFSGTCIYLSITHLDKGTFKANLKHGINFDHLAKPLWERLVSKYGLSQGSRPFERYV